jgi:7-carboxy-7-deazaguanine synthase
MSYAVKEIFLTLQGEGMQAGRRAVFLRFAGCNLWSGREEDRAEAQCRFCDTDFVGTDGENGGRYESEVLAGGSRRCGARAIGGWSSSPAASRCSSSTRR